MMKNKLICVLGIGLLAAMLQTGCGGASADYAVTEEAAAEMPMEEVIYEDTSMTMATGAVNDVLKESGTMEETAVEPEEKEAKVSTERKLIRTVNLNLETENYDSLMVGLEQKINALGGYIEYKDAYHGNYNSRTNSYRNRYANITARIPASKLDEFTESVGEIGNITYESESVEDVTLKYVDLSSHKKMLIAQQERLMELLETAESMEDIIAIESRLSEVRYQIESMESQLRTFDNQVDYSTVHINIEEVERYTPQPEKSAWDRIKAGFGDNVYRVMNGIKNFAIEFVIAIPVLLAWAVGIGVVMLIVRVVLKRRNKKAEETGNEKCRFRKKKDLEVTSKEEELK